MLNKFMKNCTVIAIGTTMFFSATAFAAEIPAAEIQPPLTGNAVEQGKTDGFHIEASDAKGVRVYGALTKMENGQVHLKTEDENALHKEIVLNISDKTRIIDAVNGTPVLLSDLKDGDTIYAYTGRAMTMSLPPISNAEIILCNIPADYAVPHFFEVQSVLSTSEDGTVTVSTDDDTNLIVGKDCQLTPYLTKNIVSAHDLVPGAQVLAWYDVVAQSAPAQASPTKMIIFPYAYAGYMELETDGTVYTDGEKLELDKNTEVYSNTDGDIMLPLRKICEKMGYTVEWDNKVKSVTVKNSKGEVLVIAAAEDHAEALSNVESPVMYTEMKNGTTFVSAGLMEGFLNIAVGQKN